ncbi:hypothetical protein [Gordonia sp. (in: high G+C Gram-positive bacteria)]|jgi:hypothetical protein|uniref:hypothetical protein n=1 Tax=Gordonia sp. (in: high G+C Gram-positive bacteria) TaxID=84139 RepID=UPI002C16AA98|nr:hypothetical protein [Gordonia sp. (in: high G+C Gram-positive bacteria)]HMS74056.1 hypothetical protein [Gordonia sp. (in: high G+C Gram-positive bacteria)]
MRQGSHVSKIHIAVLNIKAASSEADRALTVTDTWLVTTTDWTIATPTALIEVEY